MDQQTLVNHILREARRDCFNKIGRIFKNEMLRTLNIDEHSFLAAIQEIQKDIPIRRAALHDEIFLFHFEEPNKPKVCVPKQTNKPEKDFI